VKKSENKIFLGENPTFKEIKELNMSKKLIPYICKNVVRNKTENV
jgi:hypothetical protein